MQVDVGSITDMMKLRLSEVPEKKDFSSVILRPLRYQVMGSVLVRTHSLLLLLPPICTKYVRTA